jgi:hypothetical protein
MANVETLIVGNNKLIDIFGYWPSFHDAEVLELHFVRGDVRPANAIYEFPALTLRLHVWELTNKSDNGFLILRHHTLATLKFSDVAEFQMSGFNHQNVLMELVLSAQDRSEGPSPYFSVELSASLWHGRFIRVPRSRSCGRDPLYRWRNTHLGRLPFYREH